MSRCFIGRLLPEEIKTSIIKLQDDIKKWPLVCKMVERENLHTNFSFLGEIDENQIKEISGKIDLIGKKFKGFEIEIGGLRAIPNEHYIRVLALDVIESAGVLKALFDEIEREVGGDSKPAHITLCRVKNIQDKKDIMERVMVEANKKHGKFLLDSIQLIKSELAKSGPVYSVVHESKLL